MRVLVACEFTGTVRDAFTKRGHDAVSCDLLPSETDGIHIQGDVREVLDHGWDLMIAHPPCTYLSVSGMRWLVNNMDRWNAMKEASAFFRDLMHAPINKIAIENPVPHGYALRHIGSGPTQYIQPWQFGHTEVKRTGLWLKNLPPLLPTEAVRNKTMDLPYRERAKVHHAPPSEDRWKMRSATYNGIAEAMADQWGEP